MKTQVEIKRQIEVQREVLDKKAQEVEKLTDLLEEARKMDALIEEYEDLKEVF